MSTVLKQKLIVLLEEQFNTATNKPQFEAVLGAKIAEQGWMLWKNFTVKGLSNGRSGCGRVNYLITTPSDERCAIELDNRSPRARSLLKLRELPEGMSGFVLLKNGKHPYRYSTCGIDVVRAAKAATLPLNECTSKVIHA